MDARTPGDAAAFLSTPAAVRERAHLLLGLAETGALRHFTYHAGRLPDTVGYVLDTIRQSYPDFDIPFHSRWRHFTVGGRDRWAALAQELRDRSAEEIARIRFDLVVTSVLLDAGAGAAWRYREAGGGEYARSEGLGVASFHLFRDGLFSGDAKQTLRADAEGLRRLDVDRLASGMQVSRDNPLVGLEGRALLLRRLGDALVRHPGLFGAEGRVGNLFDHLRGRTMNGSLPAPSILEAILRGFGGIWPGRHEIAGINLGDTWRHSAIQAADASAGFVPFHKLSQWLSYSLIEPLQDAGIAVSDCDALTGLAEYRNGGLLIDAGVLTPRDPTLPTRPLAVGDEAVVEWRALTVALLDRIAEELRRRLDLDARRLPLVKVLEGGTWAAGRRIAREKRPDGAPPLAIESDGTVF
jgi:Protein of unknown function (DUF1688)